MARREPGDPFAKGGLARSPVAPAKAGDGRKAMADAVSSAKADDASKEPAEPAVSVVADGARREPAAVAASQGGVRKRARRSSLEMSGDHSLCVASSAGEPRHPAGVVPGLYREMHRVLDGVKWLHELAGRCAETPDDLARAIKTLVQEVGGYCDRADELRKAKRERRSCATQADSGALSEADRKRAERDLRDLIEAAAGDSEMVAQVAVEEWPEAVYVNTKMVKTSFRSHEGVRVLLVREDCVRDGDVLRVLEEQFAGLARVAGPEGLKPGGLAALESVGSCTIIDDSAETEQSPTRLLIVAKLAGARDDRQLIVACQRAVREARKRGASGIMVHPSFADDDLGLLRRVLECCVGPDPLSVEVCVKGREKPATKDGDERKGMDALESRKTIVVKPGGKSYADTLKSVTACVDPAVQGVAVKKVTVTPEGNIKLQIRETRAGGGRAFADSVAQTAGAEVKETGRELALGLRDLDPTVTVEDVHAALSKAGFTTERVVMGDLREGQTGRRSATIRLPRAAGRRLLSLGRLEVGWARSKCRITEWITPLCCFRCQQFGHMAKDCKHLKVDGKKCFRCGSSGHIAKMCKSAPRCYVCDVEGHRADSLSCPKQRTPAETQPQAGPEVTKPLTRRQRRRAMEVENFDDDRAGTQNGTAEKGTHNSDEVVTMQH